MAPRPSWKGYLKLSLVSCPVALYPAASASERLSLHMLNGETGHRLKQQYVDSETGDIVERDDRVKGFEVGKGDYVVVTDDELAAVKIESSHTLEIEKFVDRADVDRLYFDNNYFIAPDDKVGEEAFAVIRDAMRQRKMAGIARVVLFGRERMLMLEPRSKGLIGTTLRYGYEVRADNAYFDDLPAVEPAKELLDLASHIIDTKAGDFDPGEFADRYQDAVTALIKAKQDGSPPPADSDTPRPSNVVNLMDALRRSLGGDTGRNATASKGSATDGSASGKAATGSKSKTSKGKAGKSKAGQTATNASAGKASASKASASKASASKSTAAAKARPATHARTRKAG